MVTQSAPATTVTTPAASFVLTSTAIGIGTLSYQWQHAGTNLTGANATFSNFTNSSAATTDTGFYQVLVTSSSFPSITSTGSVLTVSVHAAVTDTWDANTGTTLAQDGSGTWSLAGTNWWTGSANDVLYPNDSAIYGAGGTGTYTVTLGDSVTANSITFSSGVYTITNTSGQTLTLLGSPAITATTNGTITVPVSVANVFVKAGTGKVTLTGSLTSTNIFVSAGTLEVQAKNGDAPYTVTNGATLKIGYSTGGGYANTAMQIYGDGAAATTGLYLLGGKSYDVNGGVVVNGAPTTIRQYGSGMASFNIFDINSNPGLSTTAAASGTMIDSNIQMVNGGYGMVLTAAAGANTATGDLILNGPLNIDAHNGVYGLVAKGSGSIRLNAVGTSTNCGVRLMAGTVLCGINNCIGTNGFLDVRAGATIDLNGTSQIVSNAVLAGTLKMTINKGGTPNCNTLNCWGQSMTYGGTLVVNNVGGTLALGDSFTLFPAIGGGGFASLILPTLGNGLAWQDNSQVDGSIKVIAGSTPPSIVTDLSGATNYTYVGGGATLAITASGDPTLEYQWKKNGTTVVGTSPTLSLTSVTAGSAGFYSCTVTNNFGTAQSQTNYLSVATPSMVAAASVQDTPTSFWPLNETSPSTAYDYWSGNNGAQNGSLTLGVAGPVPPAYAGFNSGTTAYQFDGTSAYIDCGTNASLSGTSDFTLEAWINTTNTAYGMILQQRYTGSGYIGEYEFAVNGNGTLNFSLYGSGGYQFSFSSAAISRRVNDGKWHHVAAERSGANGYLYVDGSLVASASGTVQALDATIKVGIGADLRDNNAYFNGSMCNVAIYNYALSAARIGDHAATGVLGTAPLAVNIVSGGWIEDSKPSGTLHDGENLGTTWVASNTDANSVTRSGAAQFASGAQVAIPANADFNSPTGTICFWMQMPTPVNGNGTMLVDRRTSTGMVITVDGTGSGGLDIQYTGNASFAGGGNVVDGNWHHVAITYDQSASGNVTVYVDGSQTGSQANTAASSWSASQEIELGRSHDTYWQEYNGLMDDFRIYNRVLSSTEIIAISTPATSDSVLDSTLMVRYNFGTAAGVGKGLFWQQIGVLQSSPVLGPSAVWTPLPTTAPAYSFLPRTSVTNSALFYRLKL